MTAISQTDKANHIKYHMEIMARFSGHEKDGNIRDVLDKITYLTEAGGLLNANGIVLSGRRIDLKSYNRSVERCLELGYRKGNDNKSNIYDIMNSLRNFGYNSLMVRGVPCSENKDYFTALINESHKRGIKVMLMLAETTGSQLLSPFIKVYDKVLIPHSNFYNPNIMDINNEILDRTIAAALQYIPPKKILLGINPKPIILNNASGAVYSVSPNDALRLSDRINSGILYDSNVNRQYFRYTNRSGHGEICYLHNADSMEYAIKYAAKKNLGGLALMESAYEFSPFWDAVGRLCRIE